MIKVVNNFYQAFLNSWQGFKYVFKTQWAYRVECVIILVATPLAIILSDTKIECLLMISSLVILLMMELINTAIETTIDRIGKEYHELSGLAKDLSSAAMVIAGINVVLTWGIILFFT